jgi:hypothetical protein
MRFSPEQQRLPLPRKAARTIHCGWRSWMTSTTLPPRDRFAELLVARRRAVKNWEILRERIRSLQAHVRKDIMMEVYEEVYEEEQMKKREVRRHRHLKRNIAAGVFFSNWALILSLLWVNIQ